MQKIVNIWMIWFQGRDHDQLPLLNKECINAWEKLNKDSSMFKVNFLDEEKLFLLLPSIKKIFNNSIHERTLQAKSDLARLMLLDKYGGIWVDSSVFPMYPISHFFSEIINKEEFFAYRFFPHTTDREGIRMIPSWFLISLNPQNYVISQWLEKLKKIYLGDFSWKFLQIHYTFSDLYFSDLEFAKIIDNMVQKSEKDPHSITAQGFENRLDSFVYKRPVHNQSNLRSLNSGKYEIQKLKQLINQYL